MSKGMQIFGITEEKVRIRCSRPPAGCYYYFRGMRLPEDPTKRSERKEDQVLEIRRGQEECRDYNTLVSYGRLCTHFKEEKERVLTILITRRSGSENQKEAAAGTVDCILKWFMDRVEGKRLVVPPAPKKKAKKVVKKGAGSSTRGCQCMMCRAARARRVEPRVHLNVGVVNGFMRNGACGGIHPLGRTTTIRGRVTCLKCRNSNIFRGMV